MEAEVNLCFDQFVYKLSEQVWIETHIFNAPLQCLFEVFPVHTRSTFAPDFLKPQIVRKNILSMLGLFNNIFRCTRITSTWQDTSALTKVSVNSAKPWEQTLPGKVIVKKVKG